MDKKSNEYDCREAYEAEIKEKVKNIMLACDKYKIPMFITFAVANSHETTDYISEILSPTVQGRDLKKDLIAKHALVMSGFEVRPSVQFPMDEESSFPVIEDMSVLDD